MKKLLSFLVLPLYLVGSSMNLSDGVILEDGFKQLFVATDIDHDGSLKDIVNKTQGQWLRRAGSERWDILDEHADKRELVRSILKDLGFINEITPSEKHYDYALVLGGAHIRAQDRINYLIGLWNLGVRFDEIVFLTGDRKLNDGEKKIIDAQNETVMMKLIFDEAPVPSEMRNVKTTFVDTPTPDGASRPNTADTVRCWMEMSPKPGKILAISNQPYVKYQELVLRTFLPFSFKLEGVGSACLGNNVSLYLDTVARYLYQMLQFETRAFDQKKP